MKVVVTARNFSTDDKTALQMLKNAGFEVEDHSKEDIGSGTDEEYIRSLVLDADAVICGPEKISNKAIEESKNLKIVSRRGIGYDSIDIDFCKKNGVAVARALGTVEGSVAESVMAYILYFARRIDLQSEIMNKGEWKRIMTPAQKITHSALSASAESARKSQSVPFRSVWTCFTIAATPRMNSVQITPSLTSFSQKAITFQSTFRSTKAPST